MPMTKTMKIKFHCYDSITHELLYPGDLVKVTMRRYFDHVDEETGKKVFRNKYELVRRNMAAREAAKKASGRKRRH